MQAGCAIAAPRREWVGLFRPVTFPNRYLVLTFFAAMDVILTALILHLGGREVNALAEALIQRYGLWGIVAFKFVVVAWVVIVAEFVVRRDERAARVLMRWTIALNVLPVVMALVQLLGRISIDPHDLVIALARVIP